LIICTVPVGRIGIYGDDHHPHQPVGTCIIPGPFASTIIPSTPVSSPGNQSVRVNVTVPTVCHQITLVQIVTGVTSLRRYHALVAPLPGIVGQYFLYVYGDKETAS
jgi:hypothetical protein